MALITSVGNLINGTVLSWWQKPVIKKNIGLFDALTEEMTCSSLVILMQNVAKNLTGKAKCEGLHPSKGIASKVVAGRRGFEQRQTVLTKQVSYKEKTSHRRYCYQSEGLPH